jgi:hypothetical protein
MTIAARWPPVIDDWQFSIGGPLNRQPTTLDPDNISHQLSAAAGDPGMSK